MSCADFIIFTRAPISSRRSGRYPHGPAKWRERESARVSLDRAIVRVLGNLRSLCNFRISDVRWWKPLASCWSKATVRASRRRRIVEASEDDVAAEV